MSTSQTPDDPASQLLDLARRKFGDLTDAEEKLFKAWYESHADGRDYGCYATSEDGTTTVLKAGGEFEILAVNKLDDYTLASPVAVGNQLFIRTMKYLYCISDE